MQKHEPDDEPTEIERAYDLWRPLRDAALAAYAAEVPLKAIYDAQRPDRPAALRWRVTDPVGYWMRHAPDAPGKVSLFVDDDEDSIARLRRIASGDDDHELGGREARQARAKEILAAFDDWEAAKKRLQHAIGLDVVEGLANAAGDVDYEAADRILEMPVTNLRDLAFHAAVAKARGYDNENETEQLLDRLIELAGIPVEQ